MSPGYIQRPTTGVLLLLQPRPRADNHAGPDGLVLQRDDLRPAGGVVIGRVIGGDFPGGFEAWQAANPGEPLDVYIADWGATWTPDPSPVAPGPSAGAGFSDEAGHVLLDEVADALARFVVFPGGEHWDAVALWVAHCHVVDAFESSPRLALLSPEPASGKTRTLEVLELLVPRPMHVLNASTAAVFRSIEAERPALLLDEVDAVFGRRGGDDTGEDLRALLNAGHRRGATIPRCVGKSMEVKRFPVYAALALAGLGDLPDTLMSRAVIVRMRRRAPGEALQPFRYRLAEPELHDLRDRLAGWLGTVRDNLADAWPELPEGITDRPADCWEPLVAIADAAGADWPARARTACVELCKVAESREASLGIRLLADLRDVFGDEDRLATETALARLHDLDEAPWSDLRGRPLDARGLARRLTTYGVRSTKVKVDGKALQGYRREDLHDSWQRYLPSPPSPEPPEPAEPGWWDCAAEVPFAEQVPEPGEQVEPDSPLLTCSVPEVPEVPLSAGNTPPDDGDEFAPALAVLAAAGTLLAPGGTS